MKLRDGKFYTDDGQPIPIEFGNKEQIELMRLAKIRIEDGEDFDIEFEEARSAKGTGSFDCFICDRHIIIEKEVDEAYDEEPFINLDVKCPKCGALHRIKNDEAFGRLMVPGATICGKAIDKDAIINSAEEASAKKQPLCPKCAKAKQKKQLALPL